MKQIKDFPNYYVTEEGEVWNFKFDKPRKLKGWAVDGGYRRYQLTNDTGVHEFLGHRLIAEAFIANPNNLPFVCHKDDNRQNNHANNLFWGTPQDNSTDMTSKKRQAAKLTEAQVRDIRSRPTNEGLDLEFGISKGHVRYIRNRKSWKHI